MQPANDGIIDTINELSIKNELTPKSKQVGHGKKMNRISIKTVQFFISSVTSFNKNTSPPIEDINGNFQGGRVKVVGIPKGYVKI